VDLVRLASQPNHNNSSHNRTLARSSEEVVHSVRLSRNNHNNRRRHLVRLVSSLLNSSKTQARHLGEEQVHLVRNLSLLLVVEPELPLQVQVSRITIGRGTPSYIYQVLVPLVQGLSVRILSSHSNNNLQHLRLDNQLPTPEVRLELAVHLVGNDGPYSIEIN
jgi:hypothetical protein